MFLFDSFEGYKNDTIDGCNNFLLDYQKILQWSKMWKMWGISSGSLTQIFWWNCAEMKMCGIRTVSISQIWRWICYWRTNLWCIDDNVVLIGKIWHVWKVLSGSLSQIYWFNMIGWKYEGSSLGVDFKIPWLFPCECICKVFFIN